MKSLEWKESYSVGVQSLNEQHKVLVGHLNTIYELFDSPDKREQVGALLSELEQYALVHFRSEEDLFIKYKYRELDKHALEHRFYEHKVSEFKTRFDSSDEKVPLDMLEFLADWLTGHILGSDQEYRRYLNNCGVF
jgi:hemerythrin-like metal-binding protein